MLIAVVAMTWGTRTIMVIVIRDGHGDNDADDDAAAAAALFYTRI